MDHPYYTVTVANQSRGWSYTTTEGEGWDPADTVVLVAPLTYAWQFTGEQLPGQLDTVVAGFKLAARTAGDVPEVQVGDLVTIDVRVGTTGPRIISTYPMRAAEPEVELDPTQLYTATLSVQLSDLSVDWRARAVGPPLGQLESDPGGQQPFPRILWRERGAEIAYTSGMSIGCPTWWDDDEAPHTSLGSPAALAGTPDVYKNSLEDVLTSFINSHQPDGVTHTWATIHSPTGHPTDYRWIGPTVWETGLVPVGVISEPDVWVRIEAVPASRKIPGAAGFALMLDVVGGVLTIVPAEPAGPGDPTYSPFAVQIGLDADWCIIPAKARRARESVANSVNLTTRAQEPTGSYDGGGDMIYQGTWTTRTYTLDDAGGRGILPRDVPTQLQSEPTDGSASVGFPAVPAAAANFLSDTSALAASWTYDAFQLLSHLVPQDIAEYLLPIVAPRLPGETDGDGRLVRHVTLFDLEADIRFGGGPVLGFITGGQMTITGGDIEWSLNTAPGGPQWDGTPPAPITIGEFSDYVDPLSLTFADVDPHLSFGDLNYVGAP